MLARVQALLSTNQEREGKLAVPANLGAFSVGYSCGTSGLRETMRPGARASRTRVAGGVRPRPHHWVGPQFISRDWSCGMMHSASLLARRLSQHVEAVCEYYLSIG